MPHIDQAGSGVVSDSQPTDEAHIEPTGHRVVDGKLLTPSAVDDSGGLGPGVVGHQLGGTQSVSMEIEPFVVSLESKDFAVGDEVIGYLDIDAVILLLADKVPAVPMEVGGC